MQNGMAVHGRCCWMRGALLNDIPYMAKQEIFDKVMAASADGTYDVALALEFLPHGKINSVDPSETPYCRRLPGHALVLIQWNENTPEKTKKALDIVSEIGDMVKSPGEPYGNYSKCRS